MQIQLLRFFETSRRHNQSDEFKWRENAFKFVQTDQKPADQLTTVEQTHTDIQN